MTDGLPALALGVDPKAPDILEREPRDTDEPVIDTRVLASILTIGVTLTVAGLVIFFETLGRAESLAVAQTLLFTFFVVAEMGIIQVIRRRFAQRLLSNRWLVGAVLTSLALQAFLLYTPVSTLFGVYGIGGPGWTRIAGAVAAVLVGNYVLSLVADRLFR